MVLRRNAFGLTFVLVVALMLNAGASSPAMAEEAVVSAPRLALWDPATHDELVMVEPGGVVDISEGSTALLRVFQPDRERQQRHYLQVRVSVAAGQNLVALTEVDRRRGMVEIRALPGSAGQQARLAIELAPAVQVARPELRNLTLHVRSVAAPTPPQPPVTAPPPTTAPPAQGVAPVPSNRGEWVPMLYRGILVREPDSEGARHLRPRLASGGLPALIDAAEEMAKSQESLVNVPQRAQPHERLLALYRELLGLPPERINQQEWQRNLERLERGEIVQVVSEIVRSRQFTGRHAAVLSAR